MRENRAVVIMNESMKAAEKVIATLEQAGLGQFIDKRLSQKYTYGRVAGDKEVVDLVRPGVIIVTTNQGKEKPEL
jgi:hypothetical protein